MNRALRMDANRRSGLERTAAAPAGRGGAAMPRAASACRAGQGQKHHNIGLTPFVIERIVAAVTAHKPVRRIWLYGSRAAGAARPTSDIDLAIEADNWLDTDTNLAHDRLESEVPTVLKFDLVDMNAVAKPRFREAIQRHGQLIYEA